jgi:photosystem II stability/assembly factor-like uncharacterized protein
MSRSPIVFAAALLIMAVDAPAQSLGDAARTLDFRMVGPTRGGRVTAVAGHAAKPGTYFLGATGGGVWKTTDYGQSWRVVSDGAFESPSIGSIDVADSDPDIVYVGTGSDGIRSNVIIGRGVYRSTDAGETWTFLGLRDTGQIGAVVVHPTNPDVVWVAALGSPFGPGPERGVYRSVDGGATWQHVLFVSERTGAIDLELNPSDPDEVYAALWHAERKPWTILSGDERESGIYKSTDAGATWRKVDAGLPEGLVGKIDLAVTPADPSRVYALVEAAPDVEGLYRSNDRGETWLHVSGEGGLMRRPFYYTNVDADPVDPDVVYVGSEGFFRSGDGGKTWERRSTPHGDNHDLWIDPHDTDVWIQSNDGGANVTRDGGRTWSTQHNQPTAELYQVHVDDRFPYWLYAGQQDNSTIAVPSLPTGDREAGQTAYWESVGGCETGPAVPRPGDADVVYANCKGRFGVYDRRTGQERQYAVGAVDLYGVNPSVLPFRFQRVVPIEVSPHDPDVVYHGSQYVHRTGDGGRTWERISPDLTANRPERQVVSGSPITRDITGEEHYSVLYVIEESPVAPGVIWAGSNDGPVHVTQDGGATWTDVTPPMPPEGRVNGIDPSPHRAGTAYVAAYRYLLDDFAPYAFRTDDYGATWTRISAGIPADSPVRVVREDPLRPGLLFAGTETGLFVSLDDGASWTAFQGDLPVTPITDLRVHRGDLVLSTMGRSFWILDDVSWLREWSDELASKGAHLFGPRGTVRMRYASSRGGDGGPEYPAPGAVIRYHLAGDVDSVTLEIVDAAGAVIRSFDSDAAEAGTPPPDQGMRGPRAAAAPGGDLGTTAGLHRFTWDLRHEGAGPPGGRPSRGPMAVPGSYLARLRAGGETLVRPFEVRIDPRVEAAGVTQADLEAQLAHNLAVRDLVSSFMGGLARVDTLLAVAEGDAKARYAALRAEVVTDNSDSYPPRLLDAQLSYLASMTTVADQAPGRDAVERLGQLRAQVEAWLERVAAMVEQ